VQEPGLHDPVFISVEDVAAHVALLRKVKQRIVEELRASGVESDYTDQAFEVAITEQDPREIVIGPPGRGQLW
jgi:hypothetical protein